MAVPKGNGPQNAYEFTWTPSSGSGGTGPKFKYTYPETSGEITINVTAKRGSDKQRVGAATTATNIKAPPQENNGSPSYGGGYGTDYGSGYGGYSSPDYGSSFPDSGGTGSDYSDDTKTPDPDEAPPLEETGTSVSGELLSATAPLPPSSGDAAGAEAEPDVAAEEAARRSEEVSAPGALIAAGVIVGLLGLGAGREMENVRPRRRLRRPNLSGLRRLSPPWK